MHHAKKNENTVLKRNTCFFIHAHNEPNRLLHALSKQPHLAAFQKLFQERKEMRLTLYLPLNKCFNSRSILPEDSNSSLACRRLIFSLTYRPSLWSLFTKRETNAWINFTACNVHNGITVIFQPLEDWKISSTEGRAGVDERRLSKRGGLHGLLGGLRLFQIAPGMGGGGGGALKVFSVEILEGHRRKNTKGGKTLYQPTFLW